LQNPFHTTTDTAIGLIVAFAALVALLFVAGVVVLGSFARRWGGRNPSGDAVIVAFCAAPPVAAWTLSRETTPRLAYFKDIGHCFQTVVAAAALVIALYPCAWALLTVLRAVRGGSRNGT
jgi:MFS family permease